MPQRRHRNQLNETQQMLLKEAMEDFLEGVVVFRAMGKIDATAILVMLKNVSEHDCGQAGVISILSGMLRGEDRYLIGFALELNKVFQFCQGRSGILKLDKIGGRLTPEQKMHLRSLTADLLQKGIDQIKVLEQKKEAQVELAEPEKRAGSDSDDVATSAKRPRA